MNIIGIYKITSPTGKVYIGQSRNVIKRMGEYARVRDCVNQVRIYNSLIKHGWESHIFETIEECLIEQLNERERHWQDFYNVIGINGLNCKLTGTQEKPGELYEGTKKAISKPRKPMREDGNTTGRPVVCILTGQEWRSARKCEVENGFKQRTLYSKLVGKYRNDTSFIFKDQLHLKETLTYQEKGYKIGKNNPMFGKSGARANKVFCTKTGKIWESVSQCAKDNSVNERTLGRWLRNTSPNKTTFKFLVNEQ